MEEFIEFQVTGFADTITSGLCVENTVEYPARYTIEDNHFSLVTENTEKVIKIETDVSDDYIWRSIIEIDKDVNNQRIMELPSECQDVAVNNIYLNHGNTSDEIFHCHICGKSFDLHHLLKNHMAEHKREVHNITHKCTFCGKRFNLKFGLNRHIKKNHNSKYKCRICRHFIDCSKYNEHEEYHKRKGSIDVSIVRDTPYFCIRKLFNIKNEFSNDDYEQTSKNNFVFTCKICKSSPYSDIHSFAIHMSDHSKCNKHECIVCDETFNSIVLWAKHFINHQQQTDLNVSTVQSNLLETEFNTFDTTNSRTTEPKVIQNSISIEDIKTDTATMSKKQKKGIESSSIENTNFCDFCKIKFTKRCYTNHMKQKHNINTNTPKQMTSIDCNESIILSEDIELNDEYKNNLSVPVHNKNINLHNHVNKSDEKSKFCSLCNRHFAHLGALTNHMRIHGQTTYKCQYCFMQFNKKGLYIMHEKTHVVKNVVKRARGQKKNNIHPLYMYKCNNCDQQFETNLSRGNHIWEYHSEILSTSNV
ncbi:hypothetical protein QTP88_011419 [Uroleucon formosanum]